MLKPGDFDWDGIFARGVRWFHSGGIYAALSETTSQLIIEAMKAAKASGAVTSFDLNYRGKLWESMGGLEQAQRTFKEIVKYVDVLIGNEEDLQLGLGVKGPEVEKKSKLDTAVFFEMMEDVKRDFPNVKMVATTMREVESANRHQWGAVIWHDGEKAVSPTCELKVIDRIGGGDGFASGLIFGLLDGRPLDEVVRLGWAHGALSTTFPGDVTMARLPEVEAFAKGGSARVQR
jgi:2-dehydro-3-deoxygluconokinase